MGDVLSLLNKIAFVIAPVFWNLVYRSMVAVIVGFLWVAVSKLLDKYLHPACKYLCFILVFDILLLPLSINDFSDFNDKSLMAPLESVQHISYRQEYDIIQQQVHIAMQTEGDDMIDGLTDTQLMEKEKEIFYKSLVFDVIIPLVWLGGTAVSGIWLICSDISLKKRIKNSETPAPEWIYQLYKNNQTVLKTKRKAEIIITDIVSVPAVSGLFKKKILLPYYVPTMNKETVSNILIHEQQHIKRGDVEFSYFMMAVPVVYWFNPFISKLMEHQRQEIELVTDYIVLNKTNQDKEYTRAMIDVLAFNTAGIKSNHLLCMTDSARNMQRRIQSIKQRGFYNKYFLSISIVAAIIYLIFGIYLCPTNNIARQSELPADFDKGIYSNTVATPENWVSAAVSSADGSVTIYCNTPENWTLGTEGGTDTASGLPVPYMAFHSYDSSLNIYEDGKLIGYVFFCRFTPCTEEIPAQQYYQTVWTDLRLSSMCIWDPFTSLKQWETGESGTADIYFTDMEVMDSDNLTNAEAPHYTTKGVLAYDKVKEYYIGFGFAPNTVSDQTIVQIADSIVFQ